LADEIGPIRADGELIRGELPARIQELLMIHAEVVRAAGPWLSGDVSAPVIQLEDLGLRLRGMQAAVGDALAEVRSVYGQTKKAREKAPETPQLGRWSDVA
jgi:hypothetical protein